MSKCPKCGTESQNVIKSWQLKQSDKGKPLMLGLYICPNCSKKFRAALK